MTLRRGLAAIAASLALAVGWHWWGSSEERAVRTRLDTLASVVNESPEEGLGVMTRAAALGNFFAADVVVELGEGTSPITGRSTLIGMATRLGRRAGQTKLRFDDVEVRFEGSRRDAADVTLTASFVRAATDVEPESLDAREFALEMARASDVWRIARVRAVDTLKSR